MRCADRSCAGGDAQAEGGNLRLCGEDAGTAAIVPTTSRDRKESMRRLFFCSLVALLALVNGCEPAKQTQTSISFWAIGSEGEQVQPLVRDFERENPGLKVRVQQIPWTAAHEKLLTAFAGNATPDVCQLGNTWIPELATLGALEPLDDRVASSKVIDPSDYFPGIWETNRLDSHVYGIPWYADTRLMFYRTDLLKAVGWTEPPATWDDWLAAMHKIKAEGSGDHYAILIPINEWEQPTILGLQTGSEMLRDGGRFGNFESPEFRRAFEFYVRLFDEQLAPTSSNTQISNVWEEFARGYFAMYITGPWNIGEFHRRLPADMQGKWATAQMPRPDRDRPSISQAGGSGLVVFNRSQHKEEAWRLIEFLSRPERLTQFYELTGNLPPRESSWKQGRLAEDPQERAFHEQLKNVLPLPRVPEWEQITTKIMQAGQLAIAKRVSVDEALKGLDEAVDNILEKRRWMLARQEAH
jgi:multiple sugar transport system substrate-binding protein